MSRLPIANPLLDVDGEFDPVNLINPYAFVTAGGSFSPLDISGCVFYVAADGDVYNTGTTPATDGQTVETWADLSGNGRDAEWAGSKPIYDADASAIGGIMSNSSSGLLQFPLPTLTAGTLVLTMYGKTGWNAFDVAGPDANAADSLWCWYGQTYFAFGTTTRRYTPQPSGVENAWAVVVVRSDSSTIRAWCNGIELTLDGGANTFTTPHATTNQLRFGAGGAGYAHAIVYDSAISDADREDLEDHLGGLLGVTITH